MNVGVLASGTGTNLQALIDRAHGREGVVVRGVASDKPEAQALIARSAMPGSTPRSLPARRSTTARRGTPRWWRGCASARWSWWCWPATCSCSATRSWRPFRSRVINVHPSLLPAFPGLGAVQQALDYGAKVFGVSVFFVDGGVDTGPVILQRAVELPDALEADAVLAVLHPIEHDLLVDAVQSIARGAVRLDPANPRRVVISR